MLVGQPTLISHIRKLVDVIGHCGSFLTLRETAVLFTHISAKDFLVEGASEEIFPCWIEDIHYITFSRSLQRMSETLQRDMYDLRSPGTSIQHAQSPDPDPPVTARHSCMYWVNHLRDCDLVGNVNKDLKGNGSVDGFFCQNYLHFLEALSLPNAMSEGVTSNASARKAAPDQHSLIRIRGRLTRQ